MRGLTGSVASLSVPDLQRHDYPAHRQVREPRSQSGMVAERVWTWGLGTESEPTVRLELTT